MRPLLIAPLFAAALAGTRRNPARRPATRSHIRPPRIARGLGVQRLVVPSARLTLVPGGLTRVPSDWPG